MTEVEDTTLPRYAGSRLRIPAASFATKNGIFTNTAVKTAKLETLSQFPCLPKNPHVLFYKFELFDMFLKKL